MIAISLHAKNEEIVAATTHPLYMDFALLCSRETTSDARVEIHDENLVAHILADLNGKTAIEAYPILTRTLADVTAKFPKREDATLVLTFLNAAFRPHPQARIRVIGGDRFPKGTPRYIETPTLDRYIATPKTSAGERGTKIVRGVSYVRLPEGGFERATAGTVKMRAIDLDAVVDTLKLRSRIDDDLVNNSTLQREVRVQPTGGGTKGRSRKKPPKAGDLPMTGSAGGYDETPIKREVLSMRVDTTAKDALVASGVGRDLIEMLGRAIASGRTIDDVRAALGETA